MKILICDKKKIKKIDLPEKVENFYIINFEYSDDNMKFNEVLTLKSENDSWVIVADDKLSIQVKGVSVNKVILEEYMKIELKFADMSDFFSIYITPNVNNYKSYSIYNIENIKIGSSNNCNIQCSDIYNECLEISKVGYDYVAKRLAPSSSAAYVNFLSFSEKKLDVGSVIFLYGIKIIYMKDFILIDDFKKKLEIKELQLITKKENDIQSPVTPVNDIEKNIKLFSDSDVFVHSPRLKQDIIEEEIVFDEPPASEITQKTPAIFTFGSSAIMMIMSGTSLFNTYRGFAKGTTNLSSLIMETIVFGSMFVTSVFLPMLLDRWEKFREKKKEKLRNKKYVEYIENKKQDIENIIQKQEKILNDNNPSLEQIVEDIANNNSNIWSREIVDNDFLSIMVGVGNLPAKIKIEPYVKRFSVTEDKLIDLVLNVTNEKRYLQNVPITYSITKNRIMPIVLNIENYDDYIKSIILQLIYYHSGNDLKIITITDEFNKHKWDYMKGLPHSWTDDYDFRFFATNEDELLQISLFLEQEYEKRNKKDENSNKDENQSRYMNFSKYYVIVTDNYKMAREMPIINKIIDNPENCGFSIVIFEKSLKNLPSRFNSFIEIKNEESRIVDKNSGNNDQLIFNTSYIKDFNIDKYSKIIANIPLSVKNASSGIPSSLTFLDMFHAARVDQLNILSKWTNNNPTISLKTIIGFKDDDKPVELDLHEKFHGPHGLIAGSTGSGKSEFIITFILSMAVNYHPYEVQFVLIDYKGGGLAGAFENRDTGIKIPHLVGTITNLDKSEMSRTLVSIKSELQRRQHVFNETREKLDESTIDIYKYQRLYREGKVSEPMSHLFIISDEFAELKQQQPEFMEELVSAARIGRSLGVHLILATQKPSGVVDDQIWSNTRFRVCLKVQTTDDSVELLKRNDAAFIKESGRFYLQVGNNEIFEFGQSGWAGAKYIPADNVQRKVDDSIVFLTNNGEVLKKQNEVVTKEEIVDNGEQLTNIVKYLYNLAKRENLKFNKLWLDNVPEELYYDSIMKKYEVKSKPYFIDPIIGEYDDPSNQKQGYVSLSLSTCGNVFITGISGSGKSTLLSTIVYSTIINHNSDEVNIYIIDLGAEKLKMFQKAPQVGEVLTSSDIDKIKFLFYMLKDENDRRFAYYSKNGGSYEQEVERGKCSFPTIIVIINEIDVFKELFENIYDNDFGPFTRNCAKVGIVMVVTSTLPSSLGYVVENNFPKKIMLNMMDTTDYLLFFDKPPIPKKNPGRGIISLDQVYEFQTSLIFDDVMYEQKLNYVLNQLNKYLVKKARKVPIVPDEITLNMLEDRIKDLSMVPIGVNIKTAQINTYDFTPTLNIITANNYSGAKKFFTKLLQILSKFQGVNVMVLNSIKNVDLEVPDKVKYYNSGFKQILQVINTNVDKYKTEPKEDKFVVIVLGFAKLQKKLIEEKEEDEEVVAIDDLIYNSKEVENFKYILFDVEELIPILDDSKIESMFKRTNGIWIGKDFDSQSLFETEDTFNIPMLTTSNVVIVSNGQNKFIKYN